MAEKNEKKVMETIEKALGLKKRKLTLNSRIGDVEEWDSLGHLGVLAALDRLFKGRVADIREMASADSVSKIMKLLKKNSLI